METRSMGGVAGPEAVADRVPETVPDAMSDTVPDTAPGITVQVRESLRHRSLEVMNFLNEVVSRYPRAVSFAPGRPREELFDVPEAMAAVDRWVAERAAAGKRPESAVWAELGQYGTTNGLVREALARHLAVDEGVVVPPEAIMVTSGCQEAMLVLLMGLFEPGRDVLLSSDPAYIGITGLARILGIEVQPVPMGPDGLTAAAVAEAVGAVRAAGGRPRALYDVPDFNNPLGTSIPVPERRRLLELAAAEDLLLFEDGPYRLFAYDGEPAPTFKHLDRDGRVIALGSFSKTLFPGLRMGYLVADQWVAGAEGEAPRRLAEELSRVKSLTTVNTPPVLQAATAALLAEHGGSLRPRVEPMLPVYRAARDRMLERLEAELGGVRGVSWNRPGGGFFLTLDLPFRFDQACLEEAAGEYGVIVCPMPFFAVGPGAERQVRLSFSYVTPEQIDLGVERLAAFVRGRA